MSIYCSMPGVEADGCPGEELDKAAVLKAGAGWIFDDDTENGPRAGKAYASKTEPCTGCDECVVGAPYIYEGSHIIIGPDSPRGGAVHWAAPASHIPTASEPRDSDHEDRWPAQHSYIRLGIHTHAGDTADVVLDRRQVAHLTAQWTRWLNGTFIADGFPPAPGTNAAALAALDSGELDQ